MINRPNTKAQRLHRHKRVRGKVSGTPERPRLNVFRSGTNIYAQIIDDVNGVTLAQRAKDKGIEVVVFDRSGYVYHGRVQALAEGAREGGLQF